MSRIEAYIATMGVSFGGVLLVILLARYAGRLTGKSWIGVATGLIVAALTVFILEPTLERLVKVQCDGVHDYQTCVESDFF